MNTKSLVGALLCAIVCLSACDDNTSDIGTSLTVEKDQLTIQSDTFDVTTRSIEAGHVLARNTTGYLGKVLDPETGNYITGDFSTQFHILEDIELLPPDSMRIKDEQGYVFADSCEIRLYYDTFYGDSLTAQKLTAYELNTRLSENATYYSDFDPLNEGYVRTDGIKQDKVYSLTDMAEADSVRNTGSYSHNIRIPLNKPYTDKNGITYNNYGTYIMRMYQENPDYFKNSYTFAKNVCPGFFFKMKSGIGAMAYVELSQLLVYYNYEYTDTLNEKQTATTAMVFAGTEEVLQTTNITNDDERISELTSDTNLTYLKTPSGIFTEIDIPVDEIMSGHESDTLNTAKIELTRINNNVDSKYSLPAPTTLLILPKDSVENFFINNEVADYKKSFVASYSSSDNNYIFNNVSGLVTAMYNAKKAGETSENWNKAVVIPITTTYGSSSSSSTTELVKVVHDMSLTSAKLVGGENNKYADTYPVKISVIYSKFK